MSADCLYVLRHVANVEQLQRSILLKTKLFGYGIWFCPKDALLLFNQIRISESDFCFAPTDAPDTVNVDLLISHESHYINGKCAELSLKNRTHFLQELATECIQFADSVEIYISEDNPYLPDYAVFEIECDMVADTLSKEYQRSVLPSHTIPSVALYIRKNHM